MMYKHKKQPSYAWIEHPLNQEALSCSLRSTRQIKHVVNDFHCDNYLWSKTFFGYENHEFWRFGLCAQWLKSL